METTIKLIKETISPDEYGNQLTVRTEREVYATALPIQQSEFFQARTLGINPRVKMLVFFDDYEEEQLLEWEGRILNIYRVYQREDDTVELYAERKLGDGKEKDTTVPSQTGSGLDS